MSLSRRSLLHCGILAAVAPRLRLPALAQEGAKAPPGTPPWRHGLALLDEPRYAEGFAHFDYVNPSAPKEGAVRMSAPGTFDNFNPVVVGVKGTITDAVVLLFETLMVASLAFGLLNASVSLDPSNANPWGSVIVSKM